MNYTKPNDKNYEDQPEDWLLGSLIFVRALSYLIPQGEGIIIDLKGDMIELLPDTKRVIVFNDNDQILIINANERTDLKEGDHVIMINREDIMN